MNEVAFNIGTLLLSPIIVEVVNILGSIARTYLKTTTSLFLIKKVSSMFIFF